MNIHILFILVFLSFLHHYSAGKQCVRIIQNSPVASCAAAGYNYTYPLPDGLSLLTLKYMKQFISFVTANAANCSVAQIAETIVCMNFAPKCLDASKDSIPPCRRVCSELFKRCSDSIDVWILEWIQRQCLVLPNDTAASGKCYEPKQFDQHFNRTSKGPLERGCQKLVNFPFCEGIGYNYTIVTPQRQLLFYKFLYGKNITDGDPTIPAPGSFLENVLFQMKNSPKCASDIRKMFCAWSMSPCFPDEGPAFYTVCQPICKSIGQQCPDIVKGKFARYYGLQCERMAPGTASHGYCKHTKLPPVSEWYAYLKERTTVAPSAEGPSTAVIIISVAIPLAVIIIVVAGVLGYKKRKENQTFAYHRHDLDEK